MWVAAVHSGFGSMSEAMEPRVPVLLNTEDECRELAEFVWANDKYGEIDVRYFELPDVMTLEDAKVFVKSDGPLADGDE